MPVPAPLQPLLRRLAGIGANPEDTDELRLQKLLLNSGVICGFGVMVAWGAAYRAYGERDAAMLIGGQALLSLFSLFGFAARHTRFERYAREQAALILLAPFAVMASLGGIAPSSVLITWPLLAPVVMLVVGTTREARQWFAVYVGLVAVAVTLQGRLSGTNHLTPTARGVFLALDLLIPAAFVFFILQHFVTRKERFFRLLQGEQARSDSLLLSILPREVATILRDERRTIADHYEGVSILFADVEGFTPLTAQITPTELVDLLNEVFSAFDEHTEKYGLEKIKTIGDCYMVASGVPRPRPDHAQALTRMALEMRAMVTERDFQGHRLSFRIGINSGPVVGGVIGRHKFIYDLWGDAVNTASRMESHGAVGAIQVTESTFRLIQDEFRCEARGPVEIKGKGTMPVWHVLAAREPRHAGG
jgi:guanylate cyclase